MDFSISQSSPASPQHPNSPFSWSIQVPDDLHFIEGLKKPYLAAFRRC